MSISVLITAGGTQEAIDTVRSITNHATGRLGSLIADIFTQNGANVTYLCGVNSIQPTLAVYKKIVIRGVESLSENMQGLFNENVYDCVIHSMAVSDYTPFSVTTPDIFIENVLRELSDGYIDKEKIRNVLNTEFKNSEKISDSKINSDSESLVLKLKQTPKIIGRIKELQPQTLLVGFKLLSNATEQKLLDASLNSIKKNNCDYILANDLKDIYEDIHKAVLIDKNGIIHRAGTKQDIAEMIFKTVCERLKDKI